MEKRRYPVHKDNDSAKLAAERHPRERVKETCIATASKPVRSNRRVHHRINGRSVILSAMAAILSSLTTSSFPFNTMMTGVSAGDVKVCTNATIVQPSDFLFLIDGSGSMCPYISQLESSLQSFVQQLIQLGVDATFAVAAFGGTPDLLQPFSSNGTLTQSTISSIGCGRSGWEAGMEAIRMGLNSNNGSDFNKKCGTTVSTATQCTLRWRPNAKKHIIIATDEDSDLPTLSRYRVLGQLPASALCPTQYRDSTGTVCPQVTFEPPFQPRTYWKSAFQYFRNSSIPITMDPAYINEISLTAQIVLQNAATISLLMKSDFNANRNGPISNYDSTSVYFNNIAPNKSDTNSIHTSVYQYGNPLCASEDPTFANFNPGNTLTNLNNAGLSNSLQAQVLSGGGLARLFRIQDIVDPNVGKYVIQNIYSAIAVQVVNCSYVYVPDATTSSLRSLTATTTLGNNPDTVIASSINSLPYSSMAATTTTVSLIQGTSVVVPTVVPPTMTQTTQPTLNYISTSTTVSFSALPSSLPLATTTTIVITPSATLNANSISSYPLSASFVTLLRSVSAVSITTSDSSSVGTIFSVQPTSTPSVNALPPITTSNTGANEFQSNVTTFSVITTGVTTTGVATTGVETTGVATTTSVETTGVTTTGVATTTSVETTSLTTTIGSMTTSVTTTIGSMTTGVTTTELATTGLTTTSVYPTSYLSSESSVQSNDMTDYVQDFIPDASTSIPELQQTLQANTSIVTVTPQTSVTAPSVPIKSTTDTLSGDYASPTLYTVSQNMYSSTPGQTELNSKIPEPATSTNTLESLDTKNLGQGETTTTTSVNTIVVQTSPIIEAPSTSEESVSSEPGLEYTTSELSPSTATASITSINADYSSQLPAVSTAFESIGSNNPGSSQNSAATLTTGSAETAYTETIVVTELNSVSIVQSTVESAVIATLSATLVPTIPAISLIELPSVMSATETLIVTRAETGQSIAESEYTTADAESFTQTAEALLPSVSLTEMTTPVSDNYDMATSSLSTTSDQNGGGLSSVPSSVQQSISPLAIITTLSSLSISIETPSLSQTFAATSTTALSEAKSDQSTGQINVIIFPEQTSIMPSRTTDYIVIQTPPPETITVTSTIKASSYLEFSTVIVSVQNIASSSISGSTHLLDTIEALASDSPVIEISSAVVPNAVSVDLIILTHGGQSGMSSPISEPTQALTILKTSEVTDTALDTSLSFERSVGAPQSSKLSFNVVATKTIPTVSVQSSTLNDFETTPSESGIGTPSDQPSLTTVQDTQTEFTSVEPTNINATMFVSTTSSVESEAPATGPVKLSPPATIGLSIAGGVIAVGAAGALAFMYRKTSVGTNLINANTLSDPMLQMAKGNPLYEGSGGVHENPLYQADTGEGANTGDINGEWWNDV